MASFWKCGFDGSRLTHTAFVQHVALLKWGVWRPQFIVLHNTGAPNLAKWMATPGGEDQRIHNLEHYYRNQQKWSSGPHLFISPTGIFRGTPLTTAGTHTPSWNAISLGIEMAGDYEHEAFNEDVRENTVHALAVLHTALGLSPEPFKLGVRGLHFHKDDTRTTHRACPGKNVSKADMVKRVRAAMVALLPGEHTLKDELKRPPSAC